MTIRVHPLVKLALYALPLAFLWGQLIRQLSVPWNTNPQYAYGWAVPFLCAYLLWQRLQKAESNGQKAEGSGQKRLAPRSVAWLFALCALAYAPTRLIQEANPEWSLVSWALAIEIIGLTLLFVWQFGDPRWQAGSKVVGSGSPPSDYPLPSSIFHLHTWTFPVCFFLVAVPWPYFIENSVIQGLTRMNTALTLEIIGWLGIPGVQHGNVIELATGSVGIDEACSGIRSLQATLMLSLFFGDLYSLSILRRAFCLLMGFGIAMFCNLGRMLLLTCVAARQGEQAIASWHDPAGITILLVCFIGVWLFAARQSHGKFAVRNPKSESEKPASVLRPPSPIPAPSRGEGKGKVSPSCSPISAHSGFGLLGFCAALCAWLLLVEVGVAAWYRHIESGIRDFATWHVAWPEDRAGFRELPIPARATEMLRYDEARQVQWLEADGTRWQLSWFYWKPGQAAGYLAKSHNPLVCMPAAGYGEVSTSPVEQVDISGLRLPFRIYSFEQAGNTVHVLYSRWDDRATEQSFATEGLSRFNRLRSIWTGRGNHGQRVITMALWSTGSGEEARELLVRQLQHVLVIDPL